MLAESFLIAGFHGEFVYDAEHRLLLSAPSSVGVVCPPHLCTPFSKAPDVQLYNPYYVKEIEPLDTPTPHQLCSIPPGLQP
jgi:hypothetical protein